MTTLQSQIQKQIAESEAETNKFLLEQASEDITNILVKPKLKAVEVLVIRGVFD